MSKDEPRHERTHSMKATGEMAVCLNEIYVARMGEVFTGKGTKELKSALLLLSLGEHIRLVFSSLVH